MKGTYFCYKAESTEERGALQIKYSPAATEGQVNPVLKSGPISSSTGSMKEDLPIC